MLLTTVPTDGFEAGASAWLVVRAGHRILPSHHQKRHSHKDRRLNTAEGHQGLPGIDLASPGACTC
jgi:hypothetical protein